MDKKRIQEIRERIKKAAKGPWTVGWDDGSGVIEGGSGASIVCEKGRGDSVVLGTDHDGCPTGVLEQEDADFIAHARQDLPDLLDAFEEALGLLAMPFDGSVTCPTPRQAAKWEDKVKAFLAKHQPEEEG